MKPTRHFHDPAKLARVLDEIRARHPDTKALRDQVCDQLRAFFKRSFPKGEPTRFAGKKQGLNEPRFLVALSGGIDSSVVTHLAVFALSARQVLPVTMPAWPGDPSRRLSAEVLEGLGYTALGTTWEPEVDGPLPPSLTVDLEPMVAAHRTAMNTLAVDRFIEEPLLALGGSHADASREQRMRSGNFASRLRIAVLYDLQRAIRGRVLGTVNRTEYCQGYNTKFGTPISYDFGVLNELYKIEVYELGKLLDVPRAVLEAAPSTGYFEGQTHEGELGATIEEQDALCFLLFEKKLPPERVVDELGCNGDFVRIMHDRFVVSEHKRVLNHSQEHARVSPTPLLF